ncbi:MAG TPA: DUF3048 domain-containing protein [Pilimelia sp.]|nr:DUF3048 domain-containing protein [Pilimelia sp.]
MNRRQVLRGAVVAAAAAGLGAGCTEPPPPPSDEVVDPGKPVAQPTPTPSREPAPLSGAPAASATAATRPAVAVPIRVTAETSPAGVAAADVLYQEYAESGTLHVTAVFQSRDSTRVGPVTEIRPVDIRSIAVLRPFVAYSGGPTGFLSQFSQSGLKGVTPGQRSEAFSSGYTSTAALYKAMPAGSLAPPAIFDYAEAGTPLASQDIAPASQLTVAAPGHPTQVWQYDAATSTWRGRLGRTTVAAASVVVLTMPYRTLEVRKPSFRSMPGATVFGEGSALAVSGPSSAKAHWRKTGMKLVCNITDTVGNLIRPRPGPAWVVYAPTTAKVTVK